MELKRIDAGDVTLVWGDAARAKADLRAESEKKFREHPPSERLKAALAMVRRTKERTSGGR